MFTSYLKLVHSASVRCSVSCNLSCSGKRKPAPTLPVDLLSVLGLEGCDNGMWRNPKMDSI